MVALAREREINTQLLTRQSTLFIIRQTIPIAVRYTTLRTLSILTPVKHLLHAYGVAVN